MGFSSELHSLKRTKLQNYSLSLFSMVHLFEIGQILYLLYNTLVATHSGKLPLFNNMSCLQVFGKSFKEVETF
ncbi:hypothetical protein EO98_10555 [Methanosarcina sp. 2.H.T.1A.6]|nr:hypothetical protein EO94_10095 [Methanosarcina sp. 2.H.T.1A.3]KKG18544.1 hypothetical protein EO97_10695 [Methanosarcina sp. 2.H.T.1A.15]KKG23308.1 hypothetical protein EO98_10555 [Methanosarcina sp. 2.H.T.1A.6]KKG25884.1 hypothetical protein EO96_11155 [Methanosarcina sp. 2.H.T.1A.8]